MLTPNWQQVSNKRFELTLDTGKAVIIDAQRAYIKNFDGEIVKDLPVGFSFEEAEPILLGLLYELDGDDLPIRQITILDRFITELPVTTHASHIERLRNIREWLHSGKWVDGSQVGSIPNLRWQVYTFVWEEKFSDGEVITFCADIPGGEVLLEEHKAKPSVIGGTSYYAIKIVDDYTDVVLEDSVKSYDWLEAETRVREILSELETLFDGDYLIYIEFTFNICLAILARENNLLDHSRLYELFGRLSC